MAGNHKERKDILKIIQERRSIRRYQKKCPSDEEIQEILEAGRWAPSGLNNQPWRFLVVKDSTLKENIAQFTKYGNIIRSAPVVILILMDIEDSYNRDKDLMAIGACIQNILLQAHSMGLGACWLGEITNRKKEVAQFLKLKPNLELMSVITLGYPDEDVRKVGRKETKDLLLEV